MALLNTMFLLYISPTSLHTNPPSPLPSSAHLCSESPIWPTPARGFPLGVQRPQWPGIKMQRGGAGARQHRVSRSAQRSPPPPPRLPGAARGQRAEEQVLEAQQRQRRAAAAQVLPGPEEAGQPREERSPSRRRRGVGVSRGETSGAASSCHPREVEAGAPQFSAIGTAGERRRRGRRQRGRAFRGLEASRRDG